jgi:hypothetical protein
MRYPTYLTTLTLILLAAAAARLPELGAQSVWFDEGWSAYAAAQPNLWAAANADETNPPLYYALIYLTAIFTGESEFGLRWLSFALGILAVAMSASLGRLHSRFGAAGAGIVAALNLPLVWASQEMRMYTLLAVLVALMALAWERLRQHPTRPMWALLLGSELAVLYSHNTGPVVVLWLNVIALVAWAVSRHPALWRWIAGQALVAALWSPYFVTRFLLLTDANNALVRRTVPGPTVWAGLWLAPWEAVHNLSTLHLGLTLLPLLIGLIALRTPLGRWTALHLLLLVGGLLLALGVLGNELHGRYLVMLVPLVAAFVGIGLATVPKIPAYLLLAGIIGLFLVGFPTLRNPAYQHDDARGMVQHYADTLTADDTVLAWSYADRYELAYYWERTDVAAQRVTLPEGAPLAEIIPLLPTDGAISINVWYTQRADYRGMLDCLLAHGTPGEPAIHEVNGMVTRTYTKPHLTPPEMRAAETIFTVGELVEVGTLPVTFHADQPLCLPVSLRLDATTNGELRAAVVVTNALGIDITSVSSVFATANGRTSIDNTSGEVLTAYPVLRLPPGTPPGDYTVTVRVFDDAAFSGYDRLLNGGPAGKNADLGTWTVAPGADWPLDDPADMLTLDTVALSTTAATNGETLDIALTWRVPADHTSPLPDMTLEARDGSWTAIVPSTVGRADNLVREWRQVQLPSDASSGEATLTANGWGEVAQLNVTNIPAVTTAPSVENQVNAAFLGVGALVGYETNGPLSGGYTVTLIWQAATEPAINHDYTVFVQLLDGKGTLIAQSDAQPAGGSRPTTTWRPGEYITDNHPLTFHRTDFDGPLTLIAGLYDERGRLLTTNDTNAITLNRELR